LAEQEAKKFPERKDLNFRGAKVVTSKKTNEKLLLLEVRDKQGVDYSVWLRGSDLKVLMPEIGNMLWADFET
jgi:hypothetical protein